MKYPKAPKPVKDPAYLSKVGQLPCSVCGQYGVEIHHAKGGKYGTGMGRKASDHDVLPLCPNHHRTSNEAFHVMGLRAWEEKYGTQAEHIAKTKEKLAEMREIW